MCCVFCLGYSRQTKPQCCGDGAFVGPLTVSRKVFSVGEVMLAIEIDGWIGFSFSFFFFFSRENDQTDLGSGSIGGGLR